MENYKLSNIYSREKTLFYFSMWNDSDRLGYKRFLDHDVKHNLFIVMPSGQKGSVWYSSEELAEIEQLLKASIKEDESGIIARFLKDLDEHWTHLAPYLEGSKEIEATEEFKTYYQHLVEWWAAMNTAFIIPDMETISSEAKQHILDFRTKSEKYTEMMNKVFIKYWQKNFPEYADLTFFVTPKEIVAIGEKSMSTEELAEIKKRVEGCIMIDGVVSLYSELQAALSTQHLELVREEVADVTEIKGSVACKGHARGTVRIISAFKDMKDFQKGEILVTEMTNPDYLPIMKMSAAVVTDEGGATCHAAIASRELHIPCIVGTKIATKALKNGNLVEVDAGKGIVRIIE